jgi:hypothetical protein
MRRLYFIIILIVAATICGCNKSEVEVGKSNEMTFSAVYPGSSKATDAGFESGDKIGLYVTHYETTVALSWKLRGLMPPILARHSMGPHGLVTLSFIGPTASSISTDIILI